jgi:hypothetical protein
MHIDEVNYILKVNSKAFYGCCCKNCGFPYETGHLAYTLDCVGTATYPMPRNGNFFSPPDSYVNPYAQTYAISLAGAGYNPPGDRKSRITPSPVVSKNKVYKGKCPCELIKCDYHEVIQ